MKRFTRKLPAFLKAGIAVALGTGATVAVATEPCDDFGECKALIEINSTDGEGNATFTEVPVCINEVEGCEED